MKKQSRLNIINIDKNGNIIEDLSKIKVPREMQIRLLEKINNRRLQEVGFK